MVDEKIDERINERGFGNLESRKMEHNRAEGMRFRREIAQGST